MRHELRHIITKTIYPVLIGCCAHPDHCDVKEALVQGGLEISVMPAVTDYPIICGKRGKQIRAWKYLVETAGLNIGIQAGIELEEGYSDPGPKMPFMPDPKAPVDDVMAHIRSLTFLVTGSAIIQHEQHGTELSVMIEVPVKQRAIVEAIHDVFRPYSYQLGLITRIESAVTV